MRKNLRLRAAMRRVIPDHHGVQNALARQFDGELAVVRGNTHGAHQAALAHRLQFLANLRREVRAPRDSQKVENVDIVRAHLAQAPFQRSAEVLMPPDTVVGAGGQHVLVAPRRDGFAQHARHVVVEAEIQEIIETLIERLENGLAPGAVGCRKTNPADRRANLAKRHAQKILHHLIPV